jgi:hypothetical protein
MQEAEYGRYDTGDGRQNCRRQEVTDDKTIKVAEVNFLLAEHGVLSVPCYPALSLSLTCTSF